MTAKLSFRGRPKGSKKAGRPKLHFNLILQEKFGPTFKTASIDEQERGKCKTKRNIFPGLLYVLCILLNVKEFDLVLFVDYTNLEETQRHTQTVFTFLKFVYTQINLQFLPRAEGGIFANFPTALCLGVCVRVCQLDRRTDRQTTCPHLFS